MLDIDSIASHGENDNFKRIEEERSSISKKQPNNINEQEDRPTAQNYEDKK